MEERSSLLKDHASLDRADASDLQCQLNERERAARRHTVWALLGLSPAGLIPLFAVANELGGYALFGAAIVISGIEASRAIKARGEALELREKLHSLSSPWTSSSLPPSVDSGPPGSSV